MSLHEELFADAAEILLEIQGEPAMFGILLLGATEPLRVDGIAGGVSIDRSDGETTSGMRKRQQTQTLTVKLSNKDANGRLWEPEYSMKVLRGADPDPWSVEKITGAGTALLTVTLRRAYLVNESRKGARRGDR